ncbi:hypothetical protein SNOG_02161 [Parastagonospora nodorum SN15]|uniref:CFEM domain-containing protein n=1 Tax=Phaeosphaeria nodorum (strain SN15 / ATCC MYA-4574 / FGSC 10173) TaxID=321614 RepID=Q0V1F3_PHANO|nr:hypothetical protein SNOG_02161 [Parastagonospora nodorum SN15]EAT90373.2 hypothetical protein SNOG_02161 [Parastagonospora nodorum SN15]
MRFSTASIFACAVAFVAAQDLSQIPSCALPCFASAVQGSGCGLSDTKCQCTTGNAKITESVTACAPSKCQADDLQIFQLDLSLTPISELVAAAAGICSAAGYPLQQASSAAAAASGAASTGMAMPSGSAMPSRSAMPSGNSSASGTMSTGAAGANFVNGALVLAMGVLAL